MIFTSNLMKMKANNEKITMVTAYDYPTAKLAEKAGVDTILVGDSLGMVVLGYDTTVQVTMDDMVHHTKAARRGAPRTFLVADMPFLSYHLSEVELLKNAARLIQEAGADAVKVEGAVIEQIRTLTNAGIPTVAHLGLTPQSVGVLGGYKVQGKTEAAAAELTEAALACEEAGACLLVLECIPTKLAEKVTKQLTIPTIGIGAGVATDGQVLVYHDLLNYGVDRTAKFVKQYANLNEVVETGMKTFIQEVKSARFPTENHSYSVEKK